MTQKDKKLLTRKERFAGKQDSEESRKSWKM
jgi:hypothetical protein